MGEGGKAGEHRGGVKAGAKLLRLLLGFSPGSASDQIARLLARPLSERLGREVRVESRLGRNGASAAAEASTRAPDGGTLFVATLGTHAVAPHLGQPLPYDPVLDFAPVSLLTRAPMLLACHRAVPAASVHELIALAGARPREVTYATSAIGGAPHLAAELFQAIAGVEMRHVRYEHTEQLYADLETGTVSVSFNNIMSMLPRCRAGALRALGVSAASPAAVAPEVPAIAASGLPGYEVYNWLGLVAPKGTPPTLLEDLSAAVRDALRSDAVTRTLETAGVTPAGSSPEAFGQFMQEEIRRWRPIVSRFRHTSD